MHLTNHTTVARSIFDFNNLRNLVKTQSEKSSLLVYRSTDFALYLLDFNCCHFNLLLTVKYFVHTDTALTSNSISIT